MKEKEKISDQLNKVSGGGHGLKSGKHQEKPTAWDSTETIAAINDTNTRNLRNVASRAQTTAATTDNDEQAQRADGLTRVLEDRLNSSPN